MTKRVVSGKKSTKGWRHFKARLLERYGWEITRDEWNVLVHQTNNPSRYVCSPGPDLSWWLVNTTRGQLLAFFDESTQSFFSVMSLKMLAKAIEGKKRPRKYLGLTEVSPSLQSWYETYLIENPKPEESVENCGI